MKIIHFKLFIFKPNKKKINAFFFNRISDFWGILLFFRSSCSFSECASSSLSLFKCFEINIMVDFCCYLLGVVEFTMRQASRDAKRRELCKSEPMKPTHDITASTKNNRTHTTMNKEETKKKINNMFLLTARYLSL